MSYSELIQDQRNQLSTYIEIKGISFEDNQIKTFYFSDNYIYSTSVNYIPVIKDIPKFSQEVDLMDNKTIVKSGYTIKLNTTDEIEDIFNSHIFKNQSIKIFSRVASETESFEIQLATATILEIAISDEYVQLKLDEKSTYTVQSNLDLFDPQNETGWFYGDREDTYKPEIFGKLDKYKGLNVRKVDGWTKLYNEYNVPFITCSASKTYGDQINVSPEFRRVANVGTKIKIDSQYATKTEFTVVSFQSNGQVKLDAQVFNPFVSAETIGTCDVLFDSSNMYTDNKMIITNNKDKDYIEIDGVFTQGSKQIDVSGSSLDFSFISKEQPLFDEELIEIWIDNDEDKVDELRIDYYDKDTGIIHLRNKIRDAQTAYHTIRFYLIQKINIKGSTTKRQRRNSILSVGLASDLYAGATEPAQLDIFGMRIVQSRTTDSFFQLTLEEVEGVSLTLTSGAGSYMIIQFDPLVHTSLDIVNFINASYNTSPYPVFSLGDSSIPKGGSYLSKRSTVTKSSFIVHYLDSSDLFLVGLYPDDFRKDRPRRHLFYFTVDGVNAGVVPTNIESTDYDVATQISVLSTDNTATLTTKIMTALNGFTNPNAQYPFYAVLENTGQINIKICYWDRIKPFLNTKLKGTWGYSSSGNPNPAVFKTSIENNALVLTIFKKELSLWHPWSEGMKDIDYNKTYTYYTAQEGTNDGARRRILFSPSIPPEIQVGDLLIKPLKASEFFIAPNSEFWTIHEISGNDVFVEDQIGWFNSFDSVMDKYTNKTFGGITPNIYKQVDITIDDVEVFYKDELVELSDVIKKVGEDIYGLTTEISTADLTYIKDNFAFNSYAIVNERNSFYQFINNYLPSFSLITNIDENGILRLKFLDILGLEPTKNIDFSDIYTYSKEIIDFEYTEVDIKYAKQLNTEEYSVFNYQDPYLSLIQETLNYKNKLTLETNIVDNIFADEYNGNSFVKILTAKNFSRQYKITLVLNRNGLNVNIMDCLSLSGFKTLENSLFYLVTKKSSNGNDVELELTAFVSNINYLVDESGTYITDENDDKFEI